MQIDKEEPFKDLSGFIKVRENCMVLREILIPDEILPFYVQFCKDTPDEAYHRGISFLAYKSRSLIQLTLPIHDILSARIDLGRSITLSYRNNLAENWIKKLDYESRYRTCRIFQGRWAELSFAFWLKNAGWKIIDLEAYGGKFDVTALSPDGRRCSFEVKYLAPEEVLFKLGVKAMSDPMGYAMDCIPTYSPLDYLQYRIYEATLQLRQSGDRKIVVAILYNYKEFYEKPLTESWISWRKPLFFRKEEEIEKFLGPLLEGNPGLEEQMKQASQEINEIWFFSVDGLKLERQVLEVLV